MTIPVWFQSEMSTFSVWHFQFKSFWVAYFWGMEVGLICWPSFFCVFYWFVYLFSPIGGEKREERTVRKEGWAQPLPSTQAHRFGICRYHIRGQSHGEIQRETMAWCGFYPGAFPRKHEKTWWGWGHILTLGVESAEGCWGLRWHLVGLTKLSYPAGVSLGPVA